MPTYELARRQTQDIEEIEGLMDDLDMHLEGPRRKLLIDPNYQRKAPKEKTKTRANWLELQ